MEGHQTPYGLGKKLMTTKKSDSIDSKLNGKFDANETSIANSVENSYVQQSEKRKSERPKKSSVLENISGTISKDSKEGYHENLLKKRKKGRSSKNCSDTMTENYSNASMSDNSKLKLNETLCADETIKIESKIEKLEDSQNNIVLPMEKIKEGNSTKTDLSENATKKRKRGRPKKNTRDFETSLSSSVEKDKIDILDNPITVVNSASSDERVSMRVSEINGASNNSLDSNSNCHIDESIITVSKKGRKRKKVDYSLLDDSEPCKKKRNGTDIDVKTETNESIEGSSNVEAQVVLNNLENDNLKSKYRWTGNTTKAISQMFNTIQDRDVDSIKSDSLMGKSRRGRRKLNSDELLDENGHSVCMVCKKTLPNSEWISHKKDIHYNLTWREGSERLDLNNDKFVLSTISSLMKEKGSIKCNQCKARFKNSKEFVSHLEECNGIVTSTGQVTCAVCKTSMEKTAWQFHNYRKHNNLAWREGDPPLNLEDQDLVLKILNGIYKLKKPLHCEKCGLQKKSVLGYLSHKTTCQKSEIELEDLKVSCPECDKKVLPVSMDYHLKTHENHKKSKIAVDDSDYFEVSEVTGKRKAATKALNVINKLKGHCTEESKYFLSSNDTQESSLEDILMSHFKKMESSSFKCIYEGCNFDTEKYENLPEHLKTCDKKPEQYLLCKLCLYICKEVSEIKEHLKVRHKIVEKVDQEEEIMFEGSDDSSNDELLDHEDRQMRKIRNRQSNPNQREQPLFLTYPSRQPHFLLLFQKAILWMEEFSKTNYNALDLFPNIRNTSPWKLLDYDLLSDFLPKNMESCDFTAKIQSKSINDDLGDLNCRKMELLEVCSLYEGDATIFCGGPISSMAWLPTPYDKQSCSQILAVAVLNDMDSEYRINKNYCEPHIIQFWDFGVLDCRKTSSPKPSLLFGIAILCGPVWHLEWCPSGSFDCVQEDNKVMRLGLLAVATSDSLAYIYSIDNMPDESDRGLIYKGEPVIKLQLQYDINAKDAEHYYATKISWTKAAGHSYIAVGYSNGLVGLFNLELDSPLFKREEKNGTKIIFPYKTFQAHNSTITGLTLHHLGGGNKWLFTASYDRTGVFWDLINMKKLSSFKKNTIADGMWLTQWPTCIVSEDETTFCDKALARSYCKTVRQALTPDGAYLTFARSGICSLSYSDWLNAIIHGSNSGEMMIQFAHRMFFHIDIKQNRMPYTKCLLSKTKLVKKNDNIDDAVAITYTEASQKYNLIFMDYCVEDVFDLPNSRNKGDLTSDNLSMWDISEFNLQTINKVAFNPNPQAITYIASGYQAGFVRVKNLHFLNSHILKTEVTSGTVEV